jgi:hypothetical protein
MIRRRAAGAPPFLPRRQTLSVPLGLPRESARRTECGLKEQEPTAILAAPFDLAVPCA